MKEVRTFGRMELAMCYFPHLCGRAAWAKLKFLLACDPPLAALAALKRRSFLPAEVSLIFSRLGEP